LTPFGSVLENVGSLGRKQFQIYPPFMQTDISLSCSQLLSLIPIPSQNYPLHILSPFFFILDILFFRKQSLLCFLFRIWNRNSLFFLHKA